MICPILARMRTSRVVGCLCAFAFLLIGVRAYAFSWTDAQAKEEMARRASLFCPGFSNDRGLPGINAVNVDALRVLLDHKYTICPDRRIGDATGAVWNSRYGVLLWNPANPKSIAVMSAEANRMSHNLEFPNEVMVWDLNDKALKNQIVPAFEPRDTFTGF